MLGITCTVYQADMNVYMFEQETLKQISEEAACQGALCYDESEFGEGRYIFDQAEADQTIGKYINNSIKLLANGENYIINYKTEYEDESVGWNAENTEHRPAVTVTVTITADDFFRLPFLKETSLTRTSKYETKESFS